jgi:dihydrofolate reductase
MKGGTSFHFVTEGIQHALDLARKAAGDKDIRIGGGVQTIRQYLQAGVIDQIHLAVSPVFLGKGESLLHGIDLPGMGFRVVEHTPTPNALHVVLRRDPLRKI